MTAECPALPHKQVPFFVFQNNTLLHTSILVHLLNRPELKLLLRLRHVKLVHKLVRKRRTRRRVHRRDCCVIDDACAWGGRDRRRLQSRRPEARREHHPRRDDAPKVGLVRRRVVPSTFGRGAVKVQHEPRHHRDRDAGACAGSRSRSGGD